MTATARSSDPPNGAVLTDCVDANALASAVKSWRGDVPVRAAAPMLGIPARTMEGIEQGRGFRYPHLILKLLKALGPISEFSPTTNPDAPP